ncbi:hypothetical protein LXA43DRAFT_1099416 [Ganoderma leucocontextum]|nr:hypothetical protein LXA43DRAFT_1099416 [Ganoderma leucocontextum]
MTGKTDILKHNQCAALMVSKQRQKDHYTRHRDHCIFLGTHSRDVAIALSVGNPNAWNDFVAWSEHRCTSLFNAALACCLHMKHHVDDVTSKHLLVVPLLALFPNKDDPDFDAHCAPVFAERHLVVPLGKRDYPTDYWGMGSY